MIQVNNIKEDTVKLSCYVDKKLFEEVKKNLQI